MTATRVGMRHTLAVLLSVVACAAPQPREEPLRPTGTQPDVRVGLKVGVPTVTVGSGGALVASAAGQPAFRLREGETARLQADGRGIVVEHGGATARHERLTFVALERDDPVLVDGDPFRGVMEVFVVDGGLTVVNVLALEAYVAGVVNVEMGRRTERERAALEAQAIVARTYALRNMGKFAGAGFDVRAGVVDQAYGGQGSETADGTAAVRATQGQVLVYDGELITPFYHSTCGGSTAAPEESFRTVRSTPYLRPVSDAHGRGYYCDISPRFSWTVEWDGDALIRILRGTVPNTLGIDAAVVARIRDVRRHRTGPSGRATEIRIQVDDGEIPVFGPDVRAVLRTPDDRMLGSTAVEVSAERRDGVVSRLTVHGRGWGHGVGMCQWGAIGRARAGHRVRDILDVYYPGARIARWY